MTDFLVRLKGKPKEYMDRLIEEGYFKTKSEIVRLGVLEVSMKYLYNDISKEELSLVGISVEKELNDIKKSKKKLYSEKDFKKKYKDLI
jgi:Arc/MetJ-type ribon-helix-helix transcriptional regulator